MGSQPPQPDKRPFKRGEILHGEGDPAVALSILLKGKVGVHVSGSPSGPSSDPVWRDASYKLFELESNIFLGASDLVTGGVCNCTFRASEEGILIAYPLAGPAQLYTLARTQKDYSAFIIQSLGVILEQTRGALATLRERTDRLRIRVDNLALYFWVLKENHGFDHLPPAPFLQNALKRLEELREDDFQVPARFEVGFMETAPTVEGPAPSEASGALPTTAEAPDVSPVPDPVSYAIHLNAIPLETRKLFFGAEAQVAARHIREASDCLNNLLAGCRETLAEAEELFRQLYTESGDSLFSAYLKAATETAQAGKDPATPLEVLDYVIGLIRETAEAFERQYAHPPRVDLTFVGHAREQLTALLRGAPDQAGAEAGASNIAARMQALPEELHNSAARLLTYAGADKELSDAFMTHLTAFRNLKDRYAVTPEARNARSAMVGPFRRLYEMVLKRSLAENDRSRLVTMFLHNGYADEWLLDPEQTLAMFRLAGRTVPAAEPPKAPDGAATAPGMVPVYPLREWLERIRNRQAEPSRNEFDMDYADAFRELKKEGKVTDRDKPAYDANADAKISFELDVQLGTAQRAVYGKPSIFYPLLHRAMITGDPDKAAITPEKVRETLERILKLDYSAFWREVRFNDPRGVITKERIMKCVVPDFILIPTFGSRGMMWQEISGRDRAMPGRFLLPAFTDENLETLLLRLIGNYRWELCITLVGPAMSDVSTHSLVSEYNTYIQFYKKNPDLNTVERDNVRQQIEKYRGIMRDIFTSDYEVWIRNESQGNLRLNKEVRRILSRYCPFGKSFREKLATHPAHADLIRMFQGLQNKEARSLESRYSKYRTAAQGKLDPDLEENLRFFRDL